MIDSGNAYDNQMYRMIINEDKIPTLVPEHMDENTSFDAVILTEGESLKTIVKLVEDHPEDLFYIPHFMAGNVNKIIKKYSDYETKTLRDLSSIFEKTLNPESQSETQSASQVQNVKAVISPEVAKLLTLEEAYNDEARQIAAFSKAFMEGGEAQRSNKDSLFFNKVITSLKNVDKQTYNSPEFSSIVKNLLEEASSRLQLRMLAYSLFAGMKGLTAMDHNNNEVALFYLLNDPLSDKADIAKTILNLMKTVGDFWKKNTAEVVSDSPSQPTSKPVRLSSQENEITATHGGGFFFLMEFLKGDSKGYTADSEYEGAGIFLYAKRDNPDKFYAKQSLLHFDIPTRLEVNVKTEGLEGTNVRDEALLRKDKLEAIQSVTLTPLKKSSFDINDVKWTEGFLESFKGQERKILERSVDNVQRLSQLLKD